MLKKNQMKLISTAGKRIFGQRKWESGFTLMELAVTIVIIGVAAAITIPNYLSFRPKYSLKSASRDLYANMQVAKLNAVKQNRNWSVLFNTVNGSYQLFAWDASLNGGLGDWEAVAAKTVTLDSYGHNLAYNHSTAIKDATVAENPFGGNSPSDNVTYTTNRVTFNRTGECNGGYVYLANDTAQMSFAVGTTTAGIIRFYIWTGGDWD